MIQILFQASIMIIRNIASSEANNQSKMIGNYAVIDQSLTSSCLNCISVAHIIIKKKFTVKFFSCPPAELHKYETIQNKLTPFCPFILNLHDILYDEEKETLYFVFDYCVGTFKDAFPDYFKTEPKYQIDYDRYCSKILIVFFQVLEGAFWLWSNNIIHSRINLDCIYYGENSTPNNKIFFLSDFNLSSSKSFTKEIDAGCLIPIAPEIIKKEKFSYLADVWSLGLLLHEMLFGINYYEGLSITEVYDKVLNVGYKLTLAEKTKISPQIAQLLEGMIKIDPSQRFKIMDLENMIRLFKEYQTIRDTLNSSSHVRKFVKSEIPKATNTKEIILKYAFDLHETAWSEFQKGYYNKSVYIQKESLDIFKELLGEDAKETKFAMIRYAQGLARVQNQTKANRYGLKALELYEKNCDQDEIGLGRAYAIMGSIFYGMRELHKAKEFQQKGLNVFLKINGSNHRSTSISLNDLGNTYALLNDFFLAIRFFLEAIKNFINLFGRNHYETSLGYYSVANSLYNVKNYKKALCYCKKAKAIREKFYGKSHIKTIMAVRLEHRIIFAQTKKSKNFKLTH